MRRVDGSIAEVFVDTKTLARVATLDELEKLGYTILDDKQASVLLKKYENVLGETPTQILDEKELTALGAYFGFDRVTPKEIQMHIVEKRRFLDVRNLESFKDFELGSVKYKTITAQGKTRNVLLPDPRPKAPFEDHILYDRFAFFPLLAKEISSNFENLESYSPVGAYLGDTI